jgi:hypothetical protein
VRLAHLGARVVLGALGVLVLLEVTLWCRGFLAEVAAEEYSVGHDRRRPIPQ